MSLEEAVLTLKLTFRRYLRAKYAADRVYMAYLLGTSSQAEVDASKARVRAAADVHIAAIESLTRETVR